MFSIYIRRYKDQSGQIQNTEKLLMTVPITGDAPINNPIVTKNWDTIGSFDFELTPDSPYYDSFLHLKTILRVVYDDITIFYGRVLSINESPLLRTRKIKCEDAYAFLGDVYYEGVEDSKRSSIDINTYVNNLINHYNDQYASDSGRLFVVGDVPNAYRPAVPSDMKVENEKRKHGKSSWDTIKSLMDNLTSNYGGHWLVRYQESDGKIHLDWYKNYFRKLSSIGEDGAIEVTKNLIDLTNSLEIDNIFTRMIPLGNSSSGSTLTIEDYTPSGRSSSWGKKYIMVSELVTENLCTTEELSEGYHTVDDYRYAEDNYDVIYKTVDFSNASSKDDLWTYAVDWIKNNYLGVIPNYNIKAIDMHVLGSGTVQHLPGDQVKVYYPDVANGSRKTMTLTIKSITYDLFHPENWQYTIGKPSEMLDHEYGEKTTSGSSTSSPTTNKPDNDGDTSSISPHKNIKSQLNIIYKDNNPTAVLASYTPIRHFQLRPNINVWLVASYQVGSTNYGVGVRNLGTNDCGIFEFIYNPPVISVPTVRRWFNKGTNGTITMVSNGGTTVPLTVDTLLSAFDAGTSTVTVNEDGTAPATVTALGGEDVPTTAVDEDGNTTTVPAAANESDGVILNDTVTYEDSAGNTQTKSGFITAVDLRFADQNNSAQDIPSFKTDYARIKQLVVDEIYAQYIGTDEAHVGTHLYSWFGHFKSIDANNIKGIDVVQGKNLLAFTGPQASDAGVIGFARPASDGTYTIVNSISQDDFVGIIKKLEWTDQQHVNFMVTRVDGTTESFRKVTGDMIASVEKIDNDTTLRLHKIDGTYLDFRKVTISSVTLTGSWSGGGKLTVNATADPNGTNTYSVTPTLAFAGNGTSNFRVNMSAADSGGTTSVRKYISGSLSATVDKANSKVDLLNSASNVVATISCASIYQEGQADGQSTAKVTLTPTWGSSGKLTVNATPDASGNNRYEVTPTLAFAGNGTSSFDVNMTAPDKDGVVATRKHISGSLAVTVDKGNSKVDLLNSSSNVVATISCADIYQEGLDDGGSTPVIITIPNVYYTAEGDTPPSGSDGATAATTISNYVANQYGNGGRIYFRVLAGGVQKWYYITLPTIA